jgi:hypothetical protein
VSTRDPSHEPDGSLHSVPSVHGVASADHPGDAPTPFGSAGEADAGPAVDDHLLARLRGLLLAAADGSPSQNPARAATSVAIFTREGDDGAVPFAQLLLDREPILVQRGDGDGRSEIDLTLTRADLVRLVEGDLHLPLAIARGDVAFRGPVRKLLRITPVLRSLAVRGARPAALGKPDAESSEEES